MIFSTQPRSTKTTTVIIASIVFIVAFIGLVYNHLDSSFSIPSSVHHASPPTPELLRFFFEKINKPSVKPDAHMYRAWDSFEHELEVEKPRWTQPLGEKLCIIDMDSRPFNGIGELFGPHPMTWDQSRHVHGLSLGFLNHWAYAKIHGYKYYYIDFEPYEDRRASWKKPPIISKILPQHDVCLFLDSDAVFYNLDLPFEWLMNYWDIRSDNNSLALALDPEHPNNHDEFNKTYLNTGFIVAQNNPKTYEIMREWQACAEEGGRHPDCVNFRFNRPGKPTDQGGFGTYIRYDFPDDIKELPCAEANGFPESRSGCQGTFIRHLWTGKKNWIKQVVGQQMPGSFLEIIHKQFLGEKSSFYLTEEQLMKQNKI
ncbi:hypothetical protein S40288_00747 [Stachybotrys chartarum IBT 40288]|nr:hypothetical protein S40288_00747 [Stachybotrys chartarum IBT 40288]